MELDKIDITTISNNNVEYNAADTQIKINGKIVPFVMEYNLEDSVDAVPVLNLKVAIFNENFNYDGYGQVNIEIEDMDESFAKELYKKLKEYFKEED